MASSINASTSGAGGVITTADNTGILNIQTANTTAVTVDASQNVGIGTTSPTNKLTIGGTNSNVFFKNADATTGYAACQIVNTGGSFYFGLTNSTGAFWANTAGNYAATIGTSNATNLSFATNDNVRMVIDSSGSLLINTTSNIALSSRTVPLQILQNNNLREAITIKANSSTYDISSVNFVNASGTQVGYIFMNGSSTSYVTSSDYRLKDNIVPMTGALNKVAQLKPVTFTWKADNSSGQGFIAHELQTVVPDCVTGEKDAVDTEGNPKYQGVDTSFLVATLTAAIQEQQTIINDLKARVTALEAK